MLKGDNDAGTSFNRYGNDPSLRRGLESGGSLLVQGAILVERYGGSVPETPYNSEAEQQSAIEQESALESWAVSVGRWFANPQEFYKSQSYKFYGYGGEAQVYVSPDGYVHKICRIDQYESPQRFFDRLVLENLVCPRASLMVEGFGRNEQGDFVVLLKQEFFRQRYIMSSDDIDEYMQSLGFYKFVDEYSKIRYISKTIIIEDLHTGNIWKTEEGNVVIVDAAFFFNTPDLNLGGNFHYGPSAKL